MSQAGALAAQDWPAEASRLIVFGTDSVAGLVTAHQTNWRP
jgi:hypothetical protein